MNEENLITKLNEKINEISLKIGSYADFCEKIEYTIYHYQNQINELVNELLTISIELKKLNGEAVYDGEELPF